MISLHVGGSFNKFLHQVSKFQGMRDKAWSLLPRASQQLLAFDGHKLQEWRLWQSHRTIQRHQKAHIRCVRVLFEKVAKAD